MPLTEWDSLSHCVALFCAANFVADAAPQSPLLVGPPGQGKSKCVKRFIGWPGVGYVSDITKAGLADYLSAHQSVRVLIVDELQRVVSHTRETTLNVCGLFLSLMSGDGGPELVGPAGQGQRIDLSGRSLALVAAIPHEVYIQRQLDFAQTGLLSRFTTLSVAASPAEARRVDENILNAGSWHGRGDNPHTRDLQPYPIPKGFPQEPRAVRIRRDAAERLKEWAFCTFPAGDHRRMVMVVTLCKAVALLNGRDVATVADVKTLMMFTDYLISMQYQIVSHPKTIDPLPDHPSWYEDRGTSENRRTGPSEQLRGTSGGVSGSVPLPGDGLRELLQTSVGQGAA